MRATITLPNGSTLTRHVTERVLASLRAAGYVVEVHD